MMIYLQSYQIRFMKDQLSPTYEALGEFFDVDVIAFGKSTVRFFALFVQKLIPVHLQI